MPNKAGQTAHHQWEVAQCLHKVHQVCLVTHEMGNTKGRIIPHMKKIAPILPYTSIGQEWAEYNMLYDIFLYPTRRLEDNCHPRLPTRA
jgi:hypothetical protein